MLALRYRSREWFRSPPATTSNSMKLRGVGVRLTPMAASLRVLLLAVMVHSTVAVADPSPSPGQAVAQPKSESLPDGLTIVLHDRSLEVHKGTLSAALVSAADLIEAKFDRKTATVVIEYEDRCNFNKTRSWDLARLEAMPEFADAVARKTRHDDKGAAAAFARAAALDPTWIDPVYELAAVQLHAGDPGAAVRALAGLLATAPVGVYLRVTSDPALSALAARPELQAVRAKQAGTIAITGKGIAGTVAISPDHKLLAVTLRDGSGFSASFALDLLVLDVATGRVVSKLPIVASDESDSDCYDSACAPILAKARPVVDRRAKAREKALRELGFGPAKVEAEKPQQDSAQDRANSSGSFPRAKLGLEIGGGSAAVLRPPSSTAIATGSFPGMYVDEVVYVEESRTVVIWSSDRQSEAGCNDERRPAVTLIGVPPVARPKP
jgi:hypothetical protein